MNRLITQYLEIMCNIVRPCGELFAYGINIVRPCGELFAYGFSTTLSLRSKNIIAPLLSFIF